MFLWIIVAEGFEGHFLIDFQLIMIKIGNSWNIIDKIFFFQLITIKIANSWNFMDKICKLQNWRIWLSRKLGPLFSSLDREPLQEALHGLATIPDFPQTWAWKPTQRLWAHKGMLHPLTIGLQDVGWASFPNLAKKKAFRSLGTTSFVF